MKIIIILFLVFCTSCCLEPDFKSDDIKIMSWNVQNLFDDIDDGEEYGEFSVADGEWNSALYNKRLSLLSGIILLNNPDIIGFQEIEGEKVLTDLKSHYLKEYKYLVSTESSSAIEVGFLSKFPIISSGIINVGDPKSGLRDILEISVDIEGAELSLFNNHWKSKSGGGGESLRIKSANTLKKRLAQLGNSDFVILGDLNENYNEYQRVYKGYKTAILLDETGEGISISTSRRNKNGYLYTPWEGHNPGGSYLYRGEWESIDHFLLSPGLFDKKDFLYKSFNVDNRSSLFMGSDKLNSWKTYIGDGYSDHLPIILTLEIEGDVKTTLE